MVRSGLPWWSNSKDLLSNAGNAGLNPGQVTKILHAVGHGQKQNTKKKNKKW